VQIPSDPEVRQARQILASTSRYGDAAQKAAARRALDLAKAAALRREADRLTAKADVEAAREVLAAATQRLQAVGA